MLQLKNWGPERPWQERNHGYVGETHQQQVNPNLLTLHHAALTKIKEWTWMESKQLTHLRSKPRTFADLFCHIWEGRNTDISGNRLDNRRKRRQPAPCTGTRWLEEGTRAPVLESSPLAALPPPPAAPVVRRRHLDFPCSRRADRHRRREAAGGPRSSAAPLDLVKLWEEKREWNYSQISDWRRVETRVKTVSCLLLTEVKQRLTAAERWEISQCLPQAAALEVLDNLI